MRKLLVLLLIVAVGVGALGFYRGWFSVEWEKKPDGTGQVTGTVDENKIQQDRKAAEEKVRGIGQQKAAAGERNRDAKPDQP